MAPPKKRKGGRKVAPGESIESILAGLEIPDPLGPIETRPRPDMFWSLTAGPHNPAAQVRDEEGCVHEYRVSRRRDATWRHEPGKPFRCIATWQIVSPNGVRSDPVYLTSDAIRATYEMRGQQGQMAIVQRVCEVHWEDVIAGATGRWRQISGASVAPFADLANEIWLEGPANAFDLDEVVRPRQLGGARS